MRCCAGWWNYSRLVDERHILPHAHRMSFTATIENKTIKLPPGVELPDGTAVRVEPVEAGNEQTFGESIKEFIGIIKDEPGTPPRQSIADRYREIIGVVKDGPTDLADNHDHYLYGLPKRIP